MYMDTHQSQQPLTLTPADVKLFTDRYRKPLKKHLNLWELLPKEIEEYIHEYNVIPYLQDIKKQQTLMYARYMPLEHNQERRSTVVLSQCGIMDYLHSQQMYKNICGDDFTVFRGKKYYPHRDDVLKAMKKNNLRIRNGMKTKTMIKHLIKL